MPVPSKMADLFTIAASNSPAGSDLIGNSLDDYLRAGFAILRSTNALASASIAAASTTDLSTADAESVQITGSATINSLGTAVSGLIRECRFASSCTVTNSGAIALPGSANITTNAGDVLTFRSLGSGNWILVESSNVYGYLPLLGGTLTGQLTISGVQNALVLTSANASDTYMTIANTSTGGRSYAFGAVGQTPPPGASVGDFFLYDNIANTTRFRIDSAGQAHFPTRPDFNGAIPWDSSNITPLDRNTGGTISGAVILNNTLSVSGSSATPLTLSSSSTADTYAKITNTTSSQSWDIGVAGSSAPAGLSSADFFIYDDARGWRLRINTSGNAFFAGSATATDFTATSDARLKSNISPLRRGLDALRKMLPREYTIGGKRRLGFIAQEAREVIPEAVSTGDDGFLSLSYNQVAPVLSSAILELDERLTKAGL